MELGLTNAVLLEELYDGEKEKWVANHNWFKKRPIQPVWVYDSPIPQTKKGTDALIALLTGRVFGELQSPVDPLDVFEGLPKGIDPKILEYARLLTFTHAWWIQSCDLKNYDWYADVVQEVEVDTSTHAYKRLGVRTPSTKRSRRDRVETRVHRIKPAQMWGERWMRCLKKLDSKGRAVLLCKENIHADKNKKELTHE